MREMTEPNAHMFHLGIENRDDASRSFEAWDTKCPPNTGRSNFEITLQTPSLKNALMG